MTQNTGHARLIALKTVHNELGALSVAEWGRELPFPVKRVYILHQLDGAAVRGVHAHKALRQVMIAMHGRTEIRIDNGTTQETFVIESPEVGLLVEPVVWRELTFSKGAVLAVLASDLYDTADYLYEYEEFLAYVRSMTA